jgi:hypothetical protein
MTRRMLALWFAFTAGAILGHVTIPSAGAQAQTRKPMFITRLYTGPDNQTHAEEVEVKFAAGNPGDAFKMMQVTGAETPSGCARYGFRLASGPAPPVRDHPQRPRRG